MASLGRFILRLLLVPLGISLAILVAAVVMVIAHWGDFVAMMQSRPVATRRRVLARPSNWEPIELISSMMPARFKVT